MKRPYHLGLALAVASFASPANMLSNLYDQAKEYDASYQGALAEHQSQLQNKTILRAGLLPSLTASGVARRQRDEITNSAFLPPGKKYANAFSASLRLSQPVFDWAAIAQSRQIDEQVALAEIGLASADEDLILRTVSSYFDWLAADDSLRFAKAEKEAIGQQLRQAESRFEVGLSAKTDVQEAQARFDASRAQEIAAASQLRSAREALRVITGQHPNDAQPLRTPLDIEPPSPSSPNAWVEQALQNNLQLQSATMNARIAREKVRETQSAHYPQLNLFAEHTINDQSDTPQQLESETSVIGLQLDIPLFAGGANLARTKQSRFQYQKSESDLLRARREAAQRTRDAYDGVVTGEVQVRALTQASKSAQVALDAIQAGFKVGSRTSVDVLDAQRELFRAQRDLSRSRYDYLLSLLRLEQAVGALSAEDLQRIDALLKAG